MLGSCDRYDVTPAQHEAFRREGFVHLPAVLGYAIHSHNDQPEVLKRVDALVSNEIGAQR